MLDVDPADCTPKLKALAEPERLRIVGALAEGPRAVGELAAMLESTMVMVSHHLGALRRAGLVASEKRGRQVVYSLPPGAFRPGRQSEPDRLSLGCCVLEVPKTTAAK